MEKKRIIKIKASNIAKRIDFPRNYKLLIKKVQEFLPIYDPTKRYQLIEDKAKREIINQEDFEAMSEAYKDENTIRMTLNIVDKTEPFVIPELDKDKNKEKNIISTAASINLIGNKNENKIIENKEKEKEDPLKSILDIKMKELEDKLVEELYNNLQNEISKSKINNKKKNLEEEEEKNNDIMKFIHKGIVCNKCGQENIVGIRYKCAQCSNFNLCENCENVYNHDIKHIMVKIRYPYKNENELKSIINRNNISYKNQDMNYELEPKTINLNGNVDSVVQIVSIKNIGLAPWRGVFLKCIEDISGIIGEEFEINYNINSGSSINAQIKFNNLQQQLKPDKKVYYSFFQMFNQQNESFGNITKIKIKII